MAARGGQAFEKNVKEMEVRQGGGPIISKGKRDLKGAISDRPFQTSLCFQTPQIFFFFLHNLPIQQLSRKQHTFWKERQFFVVEN